MHALNIEVGKVMLEIAKTSPASNNPKYRLPPHSREKNPRNRQPKLQVPHSAAGNLRRDRSRPDDLLMRRMCGWFGLIFHCLYVRAGPCPLDGSQGILAGKTSPRLIDGEITQNKF